MQLTIGSSPTRDSDGIIVIRGRQQIVMEWGQFNAELMLTMDLYSAGGGHIARLRRNQWTFNDRERFDFTTRAKSFSLVDVMAEQVVLEGRVVGRDAVTITRGTFHASGGQPIEITEEDWNGAGDSGASTESSFRPTIPPFSVDEIALIRKAVKASDKAVECPRCRGPLTMQHMTKHDSLMVSCTVCKCNLVIRRRA